PELLYHVRVPFANPTVGESPMEDFEAAPAPGPSSSNRKWLWGGPLGCLLVSVLCCGLPLMIVPAVFGALKSSVAYRESLSRVEHDPRVIENIGAPVQPAWLVSGSISTTNDTGRAQLTYGVSGPKGDGTIE